MEVNNTQTKERTEQVKKPLTGKNFNMSGGFAWHVHHLILLEWCWSLQERRGNIKNWKPAHEHATRLRLLRFVKRPYPGWLRNVEDAACKRFEKEMLRRGIPSFNSFKYYKQIFADCCQRSLRGMRNQIAALHNKECVKHHNCTWTGRSIKFPNRRVT